jgi:hypothetical protein
MATEEADTWYKELAWLHRHHRKGIHQLGRRPVGNSGEGFILFCNHGQTKHLMHNIPDVVAHIEAYK